MGVGAPLVGARLPGEASTLQIKQHTFCESGALYAMQGCRMLWACPAEA